MAPDRAGTSGNPHVDNIKTTYEYVDAYSCIRNVSVQTGEEFSPEFLRKPRLGLPTTNEEPFHGLPIEFEKNGYPNVSSRYEESVRYRHVSSVSEGFYFWKLKFLYSFGGRILPRPSDGKLRYVGGITRLPDEDLDALISVSSNDDFHHMIEEYHEPENGSQRLCVFLVSLKDPAGPFSYDSVSQSSNSDYEYVIAVNGMTGFSLKSCSIKESIDGATTDFNKTYQQELPASSLDMTTNALSANIMQTHSDIMTLNQASGVTAKLTGLMGYSEPVNQQDNFQDANKPYMVWKEDMIKWNEPHDLELISDLTNSQENKHTTSQDLGTVCMTETACILSSNSTDYNPPSNDMEILNSVNFTPISSDVSLGESYQDNVDGKNLSEDKNVGYISGIPVMVEDVTVDLPPEIPLLTKVEEPNAQSVTQSDNADVAYDESVADEFRCGTAIAELEAGIHGLQIIKNADLEELHDVGSERLIVHFDLKCENLLVNLGDPNRPDMQGKK
ncbi:hypothetical protein Tco_0815919 [Tanacetum coccineum]